MIHAQGQSFWWDFQLGSFCSTSCMGSTGQYLSPEEIALASGVQLSADQSSELLLEFVNRPQDDAYTRACTLTRLAFINRFTPAETKGIISAAKTNADLELYLWKMQQAQEVSLLDQETIVGVQTLEYAGLLASGRSAKILRAP